MSDPKSEKQLLKYQKFLEGCFKSLEYNVYINIAGVCRWPLNKLEEAVNEYLEKGKPYAINIILWSAQVGKKEQWIKFAVLHGATDINDPQRYLVIEGNIVDTHKGCRSFDEAKEVSKAVQSCKTVKEYEDVFQKIILKNGPKNDAIVETTYDSNDEVSFYEDNPRCEPINEVEYANPNDRIRYALKNYKTLEDHLNMQINFDPKSEDLIRSELSHVLSHWKIMDQWLPYFSGNPSLCIRFNHPAKWGCGCFDDLMQHRCVLCGSTRHGLFTLYTTSLQCDKHAKIQEQMNSMESQFGITRDNLDLFVKTEKDKIRGQ